MAVIISCDGQDCRPFDYAQGRLLAMTGLFGCVVVVINCCGQDCRGLLRRPRNDGGSIEIAAARCVETRNDGGED